MLDTCVLQFAKQPIAGLVKTRMQPHLSSEQSCALHQALTRHTYQSLSVSPLWDYQCWVGGALNSSFFQSLEGIDPQMLRQQPDGDLGERMHHALSHALASYRFAIVVGSDCPFLQAEHIMAMQQQLRAGNDASVIGALDGGYVALGVGRSDFGLFDQVSWGTDTVLSQTLDRMDNLGWRYHCHQALADIDRPEDLGLLNEFHWGQEFLQ